MTECNCEKCQSIKDAISAFGSDTVVFHYYDEKPVVRMNWFSFLIGFVWGAVACGIAANIISAINQ